MRDLLVIFIHSEVAWIKKKFRKNWQIKERNAIKVINAAKEGMEKRESWNTRVKIKRERAKQRSLDKKQNNGIETKKKNKEIWKKREDVRHKLER